jgi:hypothetical protein
MFTIIAPVAHSLIVCCKKTPSTNEQRLYKKDYLRTKLRVKLKKALKYCDYTKETNYKISDACHVLWDDIEEISDEILRTTLDTTIQ